MAKAESPAKGLATIIGSLVLVNYLTGWLMGYPVVYCGLSAPFSKLYLDWGLMALYGIVIYALVSILTRNVMGVIAATLGFVAINELPRLAAMVFDVGGSCGR